MENNNQFDRFSALWKKEDLDSSRDKKYSEQDIKNFKMKNSTDFSHALNKTIIFDFILKSLLIAGMVILIIFYSANPTVTVSLAVCISLTIYTLMKEWSVKSEFAKINASTKNLSSLIKDKIRFYHQSFTKLNMMLALSNALVFWVGSLYYYYAKYGAFHKRDTEDIIISILFLGAAFFISYFAYSFQYKFYLRELKECLYDLDEDRTAELTIKKLIHRKRIFIVGVALTFILGIFLFLFILLN